MKNGERSYRYLPTLYALKNKLDYNIPLTGECSGPIKYANNDDLRQGIRF